MPDYQNKTKAELIKELQRLQEENELLTASFSKDRSEHLQVEEALSESKTLLASIIDSTSDLIWSVDPYEFRLLTFNIALEIFFRKEGIKIEKGMLLTEILPGELVNKLEYLYTRTLQNGSFVTEYKTTLGKRTLMINLHLLVSGSGPYAISVFAKDITERKKAEEALMESKESYRLLFENSGEAILLTNPDGSIYSANPEACRIYGRSEDEICKLGRNCTSDLNDPRLKLAIEERKKTGKFKGELNQVRKDGTIFPAEITSIVFTDTSGNERTSMIVHDISERKLIEKELHLQSEIMKNLSEGINLIRVRDEVIVFTNPKFDKMFGYYSGELIGRHVSILNAPGDKSPEEVKQDIVNTIKSSGEWHGEILNIKKNGNSFWCYVKISVFDHPDFGKVYLSVHTDINKRKMVEAELRENEAKFRSVFENSLIGISIANSEGGLLQVNNAYAHLYGYENPKLLLSEVNDTTVLYTHPEERKEVLRELKKNGFMEPKEFELIRRDGSHFFALVSAREIRDSEGKLLYNQAAHIDLTERKRAEEKIHEASQYTRNLLEASIDPFVTINSKGKISDVNLATERITGFDREKLIGSDFAVYFTAPEQARKGYKKVFSKGAVKDYPLKMLHKSGKKTNVLYNATLFKNADGEVQGVFAAARDITELKKIERELRTSKKILEKLIRYQNQIRENDRAQIAINLHDDIGQKLTAINLNITWLKSRIGVQSKAVKEKLEEVNIMIKETIEGIQDFSSNLRPEILFDLGLVSAFDSFLKKFEKQSGLKCLFNHDTEEFEVKKHISLTLYRIFQEAMTNVARHSEASIVEVTFRQTKNIIEMLIKDNGVGINEEKVHALTSMGIAGIKERVRIINGQVSIKGEKNHGTTIRVTVPVKKVSSYD